MKIKKLNFFFNLEFARPKPSSEITAFCDILSYSDKYHKKNYFDKFLAHISKLEGKIVKNENW